MMRYLIGIGGMALFLGACGHGAQTLDVHAEGEVQAKAQASAATAPGPGEAGGAPVAVGCQPGNSAAGASICWSDMQDATAERQAFLEQQLRVESQLRTTCADLVPTESEHCIDVSERDKAVSPLQHYRDIASVMELKVERYLPGQTGPVLQTVGGRVVYDSVPGLTKEGLERLIDCHLARHRALSYRMQDVSQDPLALPGVRVLVEPVGTGLAVDIRAADAEVVAKVLDRVRGLGLRAVEARKR